MKITVVTISFNQSVFLKQCIDSVLNQDWAEIEYIVVDPGSTDGSRELIESYGNKIIAVFEKDNGPADGLNKGFALATGDIFSYLNSDDYLLPKTFQRISNHFQEFEADVIYGNSIVVNAKDTVLRKVYPDVFDLEACAYGACILIQPSSFFTRRAFQLTNGFNEKNRSNWDGELFIDMALAGCKFKKVSDTYSAYRIHDQSITGTGRLEELHHSYKQRMFEKIKGRSFTENDKLIQRYYQLKRKILNPLDTLERLRFGPVFGGSK